MTATGLLDDLRNKGVRLSVEEDRLAVDAPKGMLTDDVRQAIRQHKQALLALLSQPMPAAAPVQSTALPPPAPLTPSYPCVVCGSTDRWEDRGIWRCRQCWPP